MALSAQIDLQGLQPLYQYGPAPSRAVNLGVGGPYGVGGAYPQGAALGCPTSSPTSEVVTFHVTGSPTSCQFAITYVADRPYVATTPAGLCTPAQLQTALQSIFGSGNVTVTGTAGADLVATFAGGLANTRINGNLTATATLAGGITPAFTLQRTTRGSCGASQFELYDGSNGVCNEIDAFLTWDWTTDATGARVQYPGRAAVGQPSQAIAYWGGYFDPATLSMFSTPAFAALDSNAYSLKKMFKKAGGSVVRLV